MPVEYMIKDNDTIQSIAQEFFKNPSMWANIVDYNALDYPFITEDQNFKRTSKASGMVKFYFDTPSDAVTIPGGTIVRVPNTDREYVTLGTVKIPAGAKSVYVAVECIFYGPGGNTIAESITEIVNYISFELKVTNELPLYNGTEVNVKRTGETIFIPIDSLGNTDLTAVAFKDDTLDILLNEAMDIDEYNDIAGVSGVESIALALKHRWETEYGELTYHPEYGSKLKQILKTSQPYTNKLLEIELIETALQDHRIVDLTINSMTKDKDAIYVDCIAKVSGQYKEANFKLTVYA